MSMSSDKSSKIVSPLIPIFHNTDDRTGLSAIVEIRYIERREGIAKKTKEPYSMLVAICEVQESDGRIQAGELYIPKSMEGNPPVRGLTYEAKFRVGVDMNKRITGILTGLDRIEPKK